MTGPLLQFGPLDPEELKRDSANVINELRKNLDKLRQVHQIEKEIHSSLEDEIKPDQPGGANS